jgi:hypothetical protein
MQRKITLGETLAIEIKGALANSRHWSERAWVRTLEALEDIEDNVCGHLVIDEFCLWAAKAERG